MSSFAAMSSARRPTRTQSSEQRRKETIAQDMEGASPAVGWSTMKLLMVLCGMLGAGIVAAFIVIGLLVVKNADQHTRIDNLGTKTVQQQAEIDRLNGRVAQLERNTYIP